MIDAEKYQPARQNMKFVIRLLRSLATKLHILARHADIFGIYQASTRPTFTSRNATNNFKVKIINHSITCFCNNKNKNNDCKHILAINSKRL
jgi:hypothetical protein